MHCNVCTVSSKGSAHLAKSGWLSSPHAHHQRLDRLFFGSRLKGAAHLGRTSPSSIPCPLPLPPEWRDTHASQQTNSQLLRNKKKADLPPQICGGCIALDGERGYAPS